MGHRFANFFRLCHGTFGHSGHRGSQWSKARLPAKGVRAMPLLEKALKAEEPIVRQNAVDELDEMNHRPALEKIKRLLRDPDKDVRQAARTAVAHLENGAPGRQTPRRGIILKEG